MVHAYNPTERILDVAIIGAGFAGLSLTCLLHTRGLSVALYEKRASRWVGPRAAGTGDDSIRFLRNTLPSAAVDTALQTLLTPDFSWTWRDAHGDVLWSADWNYVGRSGYDLIVGMHQPDIEAIAEDQLQSGSGGLLHFDHELTHLQQHRDFVSLRFRHRSHPDTETTVRARYVVGADSASSRVRELNHIESDDTGFASDWLVLDLLPNRRGAEILQANGYYQLCDPKRPLTCVWSGPRRRRFEFMRLPDEDSDELASEQSAWRLLSDFGLTPDECEIERSAVYTFRARITKQWRAGRCLLVGDAAHLTPPFLGQGLQMGMRDVANLAWRLPLVCKGIASPDLLDAYGREREAPCRFLINLAVELGKVVCVRNEEEATRVHADFRKSMSGQIGHPPLGKPGSFGTRHSLAGTICLHRQIKDRRDGQVKQLDDVLHGAQWQLLLWEKDLPALSAQATALLSALSVATFTLHSGDDVTGEYGDFFRREVKGDFILARPDFYICDAGRLQDLDKVLMEVGAVLCLAS